MSDTLLHCFACDAFTPQAGDELQCSVCSSDFVEIVQVERSPTGNRNSNQGRAPEHGAAQSQDTPGLPGMLSSLLSSILPSGMLNVNDDQSETEDNRAASHPTQQSAGTQTANDVPAEHAAAPELPPFNDFFSQMFGQFPQGRASANPMAGGNGSSYTRTTHGPGGSSFTFSFGSSSGNQPLFYSSAGPRNAPGQMPNHPFPFGNVNDGIPQIQNFPDLASFLAQALGAVPGRAGDYASNETFDNIISELMNRNPQSNVQAATDRAIAQIHRFTLKEGAEGLEGSKIGEECSICQEDYKAGDTLVDLRCHHVYHDECLVSWVKTNGVCPICRAPVQEVEEVPEQETLD